MDKYEYKLKLEQLNTLVEAKDYKAAAQIASGINWRKVKSVATLCMVGEIFERNHQYEISREILLMAYDRSPVGRNIIYRLTLVALKMGNLEEAQEYYEEFIEVAPHDNMKYVLKYEIARVKGVGTDELISILEEFKEREYTEEWAFELAYLYHRSGKPEKCVEICDELILWFGEGSYVEKALELKMIYQPLNKLQEDKYRRIKMQEDGIPEGVTEVSPRDIRTSGAMLSDTVRIPNIHADTGRFNTVNLQAELVKGMQQIMDATEPEMVSDAMDSIKKMVGDVPSLYPQEEEPEPEEEPGEITKRYGPIGALDAGLEEGVMMDPALNIDFHSILSEEYDGQISINVPEAPKPDLQITGQMSIEDILAEWERTKEAARTAIAEAEQRKLEQVKARALQQAENIMELLNEVEQGLEEITARAPGARAVQVPEEAGAEPEPGTLPEEAGAELEPGTLPEDRAAGEWPGEAPVEVLEQAPSEALEPSMEVSGEPLGAGSPQNRETVPEAAPEPRETSPEPQTEELAAALETALEPRETAAAMQSETMAVVPENLSETSEVSPQAAKAETEDPPEPRRSIGGLRGVLKPKLRFELEEDPLSQPQAAVTSGRQPNAETETPPRQQPDAETGTPPKQPKPKTEAVSTQPDAETGAVPKQQSDAWTGTESRSKSEVRLTKLTEEQRQIFTYFTLIGGMEQQLCQALQGARDDKKGSNTSALGNLVVLGGRGSGKTMLATDFIKAYQQFSGQNGKKVGKISASVLNRKDIGKLFSAVTGGYLIIEKAGDLSKETVDMMAELMQGDTGGLLVILEDERAGIEKVMARKEAFANMFTECIRIPVFTNDELVVFAKSYAREQNCEIEDMGILALYNSISNIQKLDEATTLSEIKEIMDDAINHATRGGLKKLFGGKRTTEDGLVLIKEKDFE